MIGPVAGSAHRAGDRDVGNAAMPADVHESVARVDSMIRAVCGDRPVSTYVHGSLALGGFNPLRSDIDVLVVVENVPPLDAATLRDLGNQLIAVPSAGRGLELSVVTTTAARQPSVPWPFLLHVTTARDDAKVVIGVGRDGDPDLVMHYTVVRAAGLTVRGEPPTQLVGPLERDIVLRYLADELTWAETHAGETYGVLNAARASCFLHEGVIVSKIEGGRRANAGGGPTGVLRRALDVQEGRADDRPPTEAAVRFIRSIRAQLIGALGK